MRELGLALLPTFGSPAALVGGRDPSSWLRSKPARAGRTSRTSCTGRSNVFYHYLVGIGPPFWIQIQCFLSLFCNSAPLFGIQVQCFLSLFCNSDLLFGIQIQCFLLLFYNSAPLFGIQIQCFLSLFWYKACPRPFPQKE